MEKSKTKRARQKHTYIHRPNAICITVYSQDGSPIPNAIREAAAEAVTNLALQNNLLIGLADT